MKKNVLKIILTAGYFIPFVFLAMNEDAITGTPWFYLVVTVSFGLLCFGAIKSGSPWIVIVGNIVSFASSCTFAWFFHTEKWEYYFKPFLPNQLIIFESVIAFLIQIIFVIRHKIKEKGKTDMSKK